MPVLFHTKHTANWYLYSRIYYTLVCYDAYVYRIIFTCFRLSFLLHTILSWLSALRFNRNCNFVILVWFLILCLWRKLPKKIHSYKNDAVGANFMSRVKISFWKCHNDNIACHRIQQKRAIDVCYVGIIYNAKNHRIVKFKHQLNIIIEK